MAINYQLILDSICDEVKNVLAKGKVASHIPELSAVSPLQFGVAVYCLDGRTFTAGDVQTKFSTQSITELFTMALALSHEGEKIWNRVGREPSGSAIGLLSQLESDQGIPRNPFIKAGALVIHDILSTHYTETDLAILEFIRTLSGQSSLEFDDAVWQSERQVAYRSYTVAYLMKEFGNLHNSVETIVSGYCRQCSITMNCVELERAASFLANNGIIPMGGTRILDANSSKRLNALMLTCGTNDVAGQFAYRVGIPAKSGAGGSIVAVVPGELAISVWSPGLDTSGNSLAGVMALERFTTLTGRSIF